ncbi:hypothetical protein K431DRAFT_41476 [Polychaeton citri CBS 116435]|uniref:Uncharacterized protein n=1 Tax=Polychaeton citri CBS 116435 TaxID=1314669 RepID=A0A9P4US09_9PEZI|nr:hypothetical protein K431DRAFT_41476 [Polychaeton citri CBS 116435]
MSTTEKLHSTFEPHPDPQVLTGDNASADVDYEPHPEESIEISSEHEQIVKHITNLYSGSASEEDMEVYAAKSIYDDPFSYCDTRYKIAGQWYGIPKLFSPSRTLKTQVVKDSDSEIVFKLQQQYTLKGVQATKIANSLVSLSLDEQGKVKYHKDMWNEKDYNHEGLGKLFKKLNGDKLTNITQPPKDL